MRASALGVVHFTRQFVLCGGRRHGSKSVTVNPAARIYSDVVGYHHWNFASGHDLSFERYDASVAFPANSRGEAMVYQC